MRPRPFKVMLVAAEASGDQLGAGLIRALRSKLGDNVRFFGVGGAAMGSEGVKSPFDIGPLSVLGFVEGVKAYPSVVRLAKASVELALSEQPDVAVLIDSWGFNLRVAHRLRKAIPGLLLIKYVAPQVWASRPGRAKTLAGAVDHLLSINALDAAFFEPWGLGSTFVGNPALAREPVGADPARLRRRIGASPDDPILLIAPGSRPGEIKLVAPIFAEVARRMVLSHPSLRIVVPVAETVAVQLREWAADLPASAVLVEGDPAKRDAMAAATVALACSGTVTTELALANAPVVVGYRVGAATYAVLRHLLTAKYATLFNLAADTEIAPEFLQSRCTPDNLSKAVTTLLDDPSLRTKQVERQNAALVVMGRGGPDPSKLAADTIVRLLGEPPKVRD